MGTIGIGDVLYGNQRVQSVFMNNRTHLIDQLVIILFSTTVFVSVYKGNRVKNYMEMRIRSIFMLCHYNLINFAYTVANVVCYKGQKMDSIRVEC